MNSEDNNLSSATGDSGPGRKYALEEIEVADASSLSRTVGGTAIGTFTEWYDFGIYSSIVPVLSTVFFPNSSLARIATFAGLALSCLIPRTSENILAHPFPVVRAAYTGRPRLQRIDTNRCKRRRSPRNRW